MASLLRVEGIGDVYAKKLNKAGVRSTDGLLKKGANSAGRKEISEKSGISETLILEWVNHVDLFRIKGVFEEYADLLEEAGVDTVKDIGQERNRDQAYAVRGTFCSRRHAGLLHGCAG